MAKRRGRPPKKKVEGLGDAVEAVTEATGVKKAVEWFSEKTGVDCGCDKRKERLNNLVRFKKKSITPKCFNKEQFDQFSSVVEYTEKNKLINGKHRLIIRDLHAELFHHRPQNPCGSCGNVWKNWYIDLKELYNTYTNENEKD